MDRDKRNGSRQVSKPPEPNAQAPQEILDQLEMYKLILESIYNGILVADADGYVTHFNKPYGQFLGVDPDAQIGKHVTDVIENTRMHIVAETGEPEICWSHRIKGQNMVVQRIPIKKDGKVIAVFAKSCSRMSATWASWPRSCLCSNPK